MEFKKFTKLVNTYDERTLGMIKTLGFDKGDWVVTEKLDGANFAFYYNGTDLRVASRTRFVDGTFFNCQQVINYYEEGIKEFYHDSIEKGNLNTGDVLTIVGELVGDNINGRVKYRYPEGMNRDFYAFDTVINGESLGYMFTFDHIDCVKCAPLIDICDFETALEYNNTFETYLSPDLEPHEENYSEGLSISPITPLYFSSGSRVWLKSKSPKFKEKGVKQRKEEPLLSEFDNERCNDILDYINNNRVLSVLSKFGELGAKDFGKVLGLILEDVEEEYRDGNGCCPYNGVENKALVVSKLKKECSLELRKEFANKITNNLE